MKKKKPRILKSVSLAPKVRGSLKNAVILDDYQEAGRDWERLLRLIPGYDPFKGSAAYHFDAETADKYVDFTQELLTHVEGALAGQPFILQEWQISIIGNLFGWKKADGTRRYKELFLYIPRKNGKTPIAACIANAMFFLDDERGAQNYIAAADKEQAALLFRQAAGQIRNEPKLESRCQVYGGMGHRSITKEMEGSFLKVISSDANTKHGGNPHLVLIDELHAQPNRELVDVLQTSMASKNRKQSLMVSITTADFHRPSICNEKHDYACKVRDGIIQNPEFLPVIYEASINDDWRLEETWKKANPNYGVSVSEDYMRAACQKAQDEPSYENTFKRLHLNIKTEQDIRWIPLERWDACGKPFNVEELQGQNAFGGLDLSSVSDLTALALYFPDTKRVLCRFWLPMETAETRDRKARVPYLTWARKGLISLTEGNRIDYDYIRNEINELKKTYNIINIGYDPYNADQMVIKLRDQDGVNMTEFRQGFLSMNHPCKKIESLLLGKELQHGGNEVLRWNASNVTISTDPAGCVKMNKQKSTEKIDGMIALAMAIGVSETSVELTSKYENEGFVTL